MKKLLIAASAVLACATLLFQGAWADAPDARGDGAAMGGQPYSAMRARMIKDGFQPLVLKHGGDDYFCTGDVLCRTYPEVLSCVMAGAPACRMAFFNSAKNKYLLVITNSDHLPMMATTTMDASDYDIADIRARQ